jgi:hypothetical protein
MYPSANDHQLHVHGSILFRAANHTSCLARERFALRILFFKHLNSDFSVENTSDSVSESLAVVGGFHLAQVGATSGFPFGGGVVG